MYKDENGKWVCNNCNYISYSSTSVREHVESKHIESQNYPCNICGHVCPTRKALKMHIFRNKHYSWNSFLDLKALIRSKLFRNEDGSYGCSDCDYVTRYLSTCENHIESRHVATNGYQCDQCETICPTRHALITHVGRKHRANKYCWIKLVLDLKEIIKEKTTRSEDGLYVCMDCGYTTKYGTTLQNHIEAKHVSTTGIYCQLCPKFCPTRNALKSHVAKYHNK